MAEVSPSERAIVDALDEPALVVSGGIVRVANAPARALLGPSVEGRDVRLAIRQPQALERIFANERAEVDVTGIAELGRSWRLVIRPLRPGLALLRLFDRSEAVSAEKMRVDFVANASHELRTPLSTVIGYAETLAEDGDLPVELRANFGRSIRDEGRRMLRIIEDLMSLSRIEADRFVVPDGIVDVREIVDAALANAGHLRPGQCEIDAAVADDLPAIKGDRPQLIQVLDNLISNAIRYGCEGPQSKVALEASRSFQTSLPNSSAILPPRFAMWISSSRLRPMRPPSSNAGTNVFKATRPAFWFHPPCAQMSHNSSSPPR